MEQWLTIGQLAQATGVPTKTIRYYEQVGVLPAPPRSDAGYRQYAKRAVHCGCGCGLPLVQLSPPQADERPPAEKGRAAEVVRDDTYRKGVR